MPNNDINLINWFLDFSEKHKLRIKWFKFIKAKYWIINEFNKIIILNQIIKLNKWNYDVNLCVIVFYLIIKINQIFKKI